VTSLSRDRKTRTAAFKGTVTLCNKRAPRRVARQIASSYDIATVASRLKTVTTNLTLNHLTRYRKRWRLFSELRTEADDESPVPEPGAPQPDGLLAELSAEQRRALIDGALRQLPEHQRLPLVLFHFEDLSYEEIAEKLGASLAKIKTDIRRARAALLPHLQSRGIDNERI
jgi:RNA polymerase sigma-70 factor (ECF subfamily)